MLVLLMNPNSQFIVLHNQCAVITYYANLEIRNSNTAQNVFICLTFLFFCEKKKLFSFKHEADYKKCVSPLKSLLKKFLLRSSVAKVA